MRSSKLLSQTRHTLLVVTDMLLLLLKLLLVL